MPRISLIVAVGEHNGVIGRDNNLPWKLPRPNRDMERFVTLTAGHPVIMGRKTWESIPAKFRPLDQGRTSIILSRSLEELDMPNTFVEKDMTQALGRAICSLGNTEIFIAGGAEIYALAIPFADRIYKTLIDVDVDGDTFFPEHPALSNVVESEVVPDFEPRLTFQTIDRIYRI